jgi:hypothetical protein
MTVLEGPSRSGAHAASLNGRAGVTQLQGHVSSSTHPSVPVDSAHIGEELLSVFKEAAHERRRIRLEGNVMLGPRRVVAKRR